MVVFGNTTLPGIRSQGSTDRIGWSIPVPRYTNNVPELGRAVRVFRQFMTQRRKSRIVPCRGATRLLNPCTGGLHLGRVAALQHRVGRDGGHGGVLPCKPPVEQPEEIVASHVRIGRQIQAEVQNGNDTLVRPLFQRSQRVLGDVLGGPEAAQGPGSRSRFFHTVDDELTEAARQTGLYRPEGGLAFLHRVVDRGP
jgi:hypothetical protein